MKVKKHYMITLHYKKPNRYLFFFCFEQAIAMLFGVLIVDVNARMASGDATLVLLMLVGKLIFEWAYQLLEVDLL